MIAIADPVQNEVAIRQLIAAWQRAVSERDLDRLMGLYADDVTLFDVMPPFRTKGACAIRQLWEQCLPYFPETFGFEMQDLEIFAGEDVAHAHWVFRLVDPEKDHPWMRVTVGYERRDGRWRIVHDHVSVPFQP